MFKLLLLFLFINYVIDLIRCAAILLIFGLSLSSLIWVPQPLQGQVCLTRPTSTYSPCLRRYTHQWICLAAAFFLTFAFFSVLFLSYLQQVAAQCLGLTRLPPFLNFKYIFSFQWKFWPLPLFSKAGVWHHGLSIHSQSQWQCLGKNVGS